MDTGGLAKVWAIAEQGERLKNSIVHHVCLEYFNRCYLLFYGLVSFKFTTLFSVAWAQIISVSVFFSDLQFKVGNLVTEQELMLEMMFVHCRIEFFNLSFDPFVRHTFWNVLFGSIILWGSPYSCSQVWIMEYEWKRLPNNISILLRDLFFLQVVIQIFTNPS